MIEELKIAEELLKETVLTRSKRYKLIQDMTISANETAGIIKGIKILNSQIASYSKVNLGGEEF